MFDLLKLNCPVFRDCFSESVQNVDGERGAQVLLFTRLAAEFREECSYEWSRGKKPSDAIIRVSE